MVDSPTQWREVPARETTFAYIRKSLMLNNRDWYYTAWTVIPHYPVPLGCENHKVIFRITNKSPGVEKLRLWKPQGGYIGMIGTEDLPWEIQKLGSGTAEMKKAAQIFREGRLEYARSLIRVAWPEVKSAQNHSEGYVIGTAGPVEVIVPVREPEESGRAATVKDDPVRDALSGLTMAELGQIARNNSIPWEINSNGGVMKMRLINGLKGKLKRGEELKL